ncbi:MULTISPECIES: glutaminase [unclassified Rhizobium]|uniref:glutaminase n=1 Tax=Rhizobium sp. Leaf453 TaxID=1736380 RepID=UPI0009EAB9D0
MAVFLRDGTATAAGNASVVFPFQSISKVFAFEVALEAMEEKVWSRVGRDPSGDPFNSIIAPIVAADSRWKVSVHSPCHIPAQSKRVQRSRRSLPIPLTGPPTQRRRKCNDDNALTSGARGSQSFLKSAGSMFPILSVGQKGGQRLLPSASVPPTFPTNS